MRGDARRRQVGLGAVLVVAGMVGGATVPAVSSATDSGSEMVVLKTISLQQKNYPAYSINLSYPQMENSGLAGQEKVNAELEYGAQVEIANFEHTLATQPPQSSVPYGPAVSTLGGGVELDLFGDDLVSTTYAASWNWPDAAHPLELLATYTFNGATGQLYQLSDLFAKGSNWLSFLSNESRSLLLQTLGTEAAPSIIDNGTTPEASNFADWSLTPWGLNIKFADYQVGPYVIGSPSIVIPFQALTAVEREGGPLSQVAAHPPLHMILLPAETAPIVSECSAPVHTLSSGVLEPLLCNGHEINVEAWSWFSGSHVLAAGLHATLSAIRTAMCADYKHYYDQTEEIAIEKLASAYYGWHLRNSLVATPGSCSRGAR